MKRKAKHDDEDDDDDYYDDYGTFTPCEQL